MKLDAYEKGSAKNPSGLAGEFFVMGELLRRGYQASFTLGNAKTVDIFASDSQTGKIVTIQVKTRSGTPPRNNHTKWLVGRKIWDLSQESQPNLFYVFVILNPQGTESPIYYIAKASDVIAQTKAGTERYISEMNEGKRTYKGKLKDAQSIRDYPMKEFFSKRFIDDGYKFLSWDDMFI